MKLAKLIFVFLAACATGWGQAGSPVIGGVWSGNVSPTSATVTVRLNASGVRVRLQISQSDTPTE